MAYFLYKYLRKKYKQRQADKNEIPTTDESTLVPEPRSPGQKSVTLHDAGDHDGSGSPTHPKPEFLNRVEEARIREEARERRKYRWKLILGLLLPNFLAAVDTTIVAPAVPIISSHFNHLGGSFNWIVAAYTLPFTTFVPLSGQIANIFGRHTALQFHMFWILIGSVLCASAVSWGMLMIGRALQGVGAAGIMNLTRIILSDNVTLADNSKNNTIFSLINGISYAVGPVIGGYLANSSWRYCFVLPIPVAFVSMLLIFFLMRKSLVEGRVSTRVSDSRRIGYITGFMTFDWPGIFLFVFGVGLVILAIQWGGTEYAWSSPEVIAPLVVGFVLWIVFYLYEYLLGPGRLMNRNFPRQVAMLPSFLYRKKDTTLLMIINFASGASLVSAFYFISIYWQLAEGYSSSQAGIQLLYYTPGLGVGVYTAMFLCNVWPRQTFYPLMFGSVIEAAGLAALTWAVDARHRSLVNGMLAVSGAGTGLRFMPVVLHAAGIWPTHIPSVQSLMSFALPLGETIGISMMGSVFANKFSQGIRTIAPSVSGESIHMKGPANLNALQNLSPQAKEAVQNVAARSVMWAFVSILPFMAISIIAATLLGNVWIGRDAERGKDGEAVKKEIKGRVLYSNYLKAAFTGRTMTNSQEIEKAGDAESSVFNGRDKEKEAARQRAIDGGYHV